ncbi:signal peptidase II [Sulfoacidibacillus thermotolerans]|uniref:signal peptidase II n=1 Tax=Sulfoacidibacillus thermotolerans TaxID=1765684 RepID=UPI001FE24527|nr:signal peptidase II [Sulfoacidibacillus thermotolerans]
MVAGIVAAIDQLIKWIISTHMAVNSAIPIWPGVLELLYVQNRGAAFSILLNQTVLLIVVAVVVIGVIVYINRRYAKRHLRLQIALGLLLGGAVGNLIDRIRLGYVIDYVYIEAIHYPVFNFADSCIVVSVVYLVLRAWRARDQEVGIHKKAQTKEVNHGKP